MNIFLVTDNRDVALIEGILEERWGAGLTIRREDTDLEAIQKMYIFGVPDLFIVDLDGAGVIGLDSLRTLREQAQFQSLPILALSEGDHTLSAEAAGASGFLRKPFSRETFRDKISRIIDRPLSESFTAGEKEAEAATAGTDARSNTRKSLSTPCIVFTGGRKVKGRLKDISLTGARVQLEQTLADSTLVDIMIGVPGTIPMQIIKFKAKVVRGTEDGYGLAFREMDGKSRDFVRSFTTC